MWLDLLTNDSHGFERYFAAAEALLREMEARPHPGKFNETFGPADLERLHGEQFRRFRDVVRRHDPERKFANDFTQRLLGKG
jgi:D-arabinono-1,4-lactone oxidase